VHAGRKRHPLSFFPEAIWLCVALDALLPASTDVERTPFWSARPLMDAGLLPEWLNVGQASCHHANRVFSVFARQTAIFGHAMH